MTPIAAHTLTQRPVVVSDDVRLRLHDEEADVRFTLDVDSYVYVCTLDGTSVVEICKAPYSTQLVRIEHQKFFSAIRDKLMWGL